MKTKSILSAFFALVLVASMASAYAFSYTNCFNGGTGFGGGFVRASRGPNITRPVRIPNILDPKFQPGGSNYLTEEDLQREYILIPVSGVG